jgi:hypothetical protein
MAEDFQNENTVFSIHKAFWPFLEITIIDHRKGLFSNQKIKRRSKGNIALKDATEQLNLNLPD